MKLTLSSCALALALARDVSAGAGAIVEACVYLAEDPASTFTVNFAAGGASDHCMSSSGNDATLTVTASGVSCVSIGYVEEKGSSSGGDTCATDDSIWSLAYSGNGYSGTTLSQWSSGLFHNEIELQSPSPGTFVCPSQNACTVTDLEWDTGSEGPLYIIFTPGTPSQSFVVQGEL